MTEQFVPHTQWFQYLDRAKPLPVQVDVYDHTRTEWFHAAIEEACRAWDADPYGTLHYTYHRADPFIGPLQGVDWLTVPLHGPNTVTVVDHFKSPENLPPFEGGGNPGLTIPSETVPGTLTFNGATIGLNVWWLQHLDGSPRLDTDYLGADPVGMVANPVGNAGTHIRTSLVLLEMANQNGLDEIGYLYGSAFKGLSNNWQNGAIPQRDDWLQLLAKYGFREGRPITVVQPDPSTGKMASITY